jgi:hypothetical protein
MLNANGEANVGQCGLSFTFTIGFGLGILQSPPLIYALSSLHYVHIYNKNFKNPQKDVGILPALHPHAPK